MGGIASLISWGKALLLPGVSSVSPRLLGFRFGGEGGFTKAGEFPFPLTKASLFMMGSGRLVVEAALDVPLEVSTARFFKLRPFLEGACFWSSKKGLPLSAVCGRIIPAAKEAGGGDSGEDPGEASVALESSTVEMVVVGDEVLDPVVEPLKVWWWNLRNTCAA